MVAASNYQKTSNIAHIPHAQKKKVQKILQIFNSLFSIKKSSMKKHPPKKFPPQNACFLEALKVKDS